MPVAIVTGASRGIGRAIALQLADDGNDVAINDIPANTSPLEGVKGEIEAKGRKSTCIIADISKEGDVQNLIASTVKEFGELNIFIANAGIIIVKPLLETTLEDFDKVQSVNARGTFLCYREAAKQMVKQGKGGKIIGAASIAAYRPSGNAFPYSVSKWTVRGMTQNAALDLAKYGIQSKAYCPGPVNTNMWDEIATEVSKRNNVPKETAFEESVNARSASKKAQTPADIANCVSFLASQRANQITGQSIIVDGGIVFS
ncbi:acetoin reductase family protein [Rhizodiscina lignyota]|uniref:Acetoin reductase family protein n=1 Tax=Rhizodiscina lignyota TaxID=1504668 RepID=A0A9P4I6L0_9PEZI|nr:acetoin reductase family protein [Rhizodiscina lignyota]